MNEKTPRLRGFFIALIAAGLLAALGTLCTPGFSFSSCSFELSGSRLALLAAILLGTGLLAGLAYGTGKGMKLGIRLLGSLAHRLEGIRFFGGGLALSLAAAGLAGHLLLSAFFPGSPATAPYLLRLVPLFAWALFAAIATFALFLVYDPAAVRAHLRSPEWPRWRLALAAILIFAGGWFSRGYALDRFAGPDEPTWETRGANFYTALRRADFAGTYQSEHPGVTLMWAETIAISWKLPRFAQLVDGPIGEGKYLLILKSQSLPGMTLLSAARSMIALAASLSIAAIFVFAQDVLGFWPALAGVFLLAFDPFNAGLTRMLAADGLLGVLMALSFAALLYGLKHGSTPALIASGAAGGLSWLTKSPGFALVPIAGLAVLAFQFGEIRKKEGAGWVSVLGQASRTLAIWGLSGFLTFVALFPAMWVAPVATLGKMFSAALGYAASGHQGAVFWNGQIFPDGQIRDFWFYPHTFLWRTTPVVLLGLLAGLGVMLRPRRGEYREAAWLLPAAALFFWLFMNLGTKRFDRYYLPAYPFIDLFAGAGLVYGLTLVNTAGRRLQWAILLAAGALQASLALNTFPYYLSYYNPLLGGAARAPEVMMIGWGEGLGDAAAYLNEKAGEAPFDIIAWYNQGSFSYFIKGDSEHFPTNQDLREERLQEILDMDYAVVYIHQWQRDVPAQLLAILWDRTPEHAVWINGLEYVRIYALSGGD